MVTLRFYLDTRAVNAGTPAPLKLAITKRGDTALMKTGIALLPEEWDRKAQQVLNSPRKRVLNSELARIRASVEDFIIPLVYRGELADKSATEIKEMVAAFLYGKKDDTLLIDAIRQFAESRESASTRKTYQYNISSLVRNIPSIQQVRISSVTSQWGTRLRSEMLATYKVNTAKNIMSLVIDAWHWLMRQGIVQKDVFTEARITPTPTKKRDLTLAQLRKLWNARTLTDFEAFALDFFKLSFLLRAINTSDLYDARLADIDNGRLYYQRNKTGKRYSVKVEREAQALIDKLTDGVHLVARSSAHCNSMSLGGSIGLALKAIARREGLPERISLYWARHTLASLMFEQGVSMDIVSAVLGHSVGAKITSTYVDIKVKQVDDAMRNLINYVLYEN